MSDPASMQDPLDYVKNLWGNMGFALPGMVAPTLDTGDMDKRIADLKAVEGWLKMNLGMLQMSIQGLEMQRATVAAMQALSQSAGGEGGANPFASAAGLWPWNYMPGQSGAAGEARPAATASADSPPAK
jgi:hypothetical protein